MIPTRLALKILADILASAARQSAARDPLRQGGRASHQMTAAQRLMRACDSHRTITPADCDPAVLGYLCCFARGHSVHAALAEYLHRRQTPAADTVGTTDPRDRAAFILAVLGVEEDRR